MSDVDGYVLIGGRSSRLGRDKALVLLGGVSLAERAAKTLHKALPDSRVQFVAADEEQFSKQFGEIPVIVDTHPGRGPLGALYAAAANTRACWIAVLACDLPFVTADLMQRLAGLCCVDYDAVIPVQPDGRLQPLAAVYRSAVLGKRLQAILDRDDTPALMSVLDTLRVHRVPYNAIAGEAHAEHLFLNINSPGDLEKAETWHRDPSSNRS
jgi:molybdopterin-guanine dinucleotide biosynthesis protein A